MKNKNALIKEYRRVVQQDDEKKYYFKAGKRGVRVPYVGSKQVEPILTALGPIFGKYTNLIDFLNGEFYQNDGIMFKKKLSREFKPGEEKKALAELFTYDEKDVDEAIELWKEYIEDIEKEKEIRAETGKPSDDEVADISDAGLEDMKKKLLAKIKKLESWKGQKVSENDISDEEVEFMETMVKTFAKKEPIERSYKEIAELMGMSVSSARQTCFAIVSYIAYEIKRDEKIAARKTGSSSNNYGTKEKDEDDYMYSGDSDNSDSESMWYSGMNDAENHSRYGSHDANDSFSLPSQRWGLSESDAKELDEEIEKDYLQTEAVGDKLETCPKCKKETFEVNPHTGDGKCKDCGHYEKTPIDYVLEEENDKSPEDNTIVDDQDEDHLEESSDYEDGLNYEEFKNSVETFFEDLQLRAKNDEKYFEENLKNAKEMAEDKKDEKAIKDYNNKRLKALKNFEKVFDGMKDEIVKQLEFLKRGAQDYKKSRDTSSTGFDDDFNGMPNIEQLF